MVLDEDALEAMLRRQNGSEGPPPETVRTDETPEYEVYERKEGSDEPAPPTATPGPTTPAPAPQPPRAAPAPASVEETNDDFEVFTREPETDPDADAVPFQDAPAPSTTEAGQDAAPPAEQTPAATEPVQDPLPGPMEHSETDAPQGTTDTSMPSLEPETVTEPEPRPAPQPAPEQTEAPRRKPVVWPPIGNRQEASSEPPATPGPTTESPAEPSAGPPVDVARSHAPTPHAFPQTRTDGGGCRMAIVQATFNQEITDDMAALAVRHAEKAGAIVAHQITVPGVYDLPLMVQTLLQQDDIDAAVVIGCVVKGETSHDELITHATAKSLQEVSLATGKPVGLGIIGPGMTWKQAEARIGNGKHAVEAALAQWKALQTL